MRRTVLSVVAFGLLLAACSERPPTALQPSVGLGAELANAAFPDVIPIPVNPEGIAIGNGSRFFAGDLINGKLYAGDLRTGEGSFLVSSTGPQMVGMRFDSRSGYLFVARGGSGRGTAFDGSTGVVVREWAFATAPPGTLINDVVVTRTAAYFTDSFRPVMYRVPLGPAGEILDGFETIPLSGDYVHDAPHCGVGSGFPVLLPINSNGIEATPNGKHLILANMRAAHLYRVDPGTGVATRIDLGGASVCFADGLLLEGHTLYIVQNLPAKIVVIRLSPDYLTGTVERVIVSPYPITTIDRFGSGIYAVTAGFAFLPTNPHQVMRFDK